jgi:two-component system, sensor histidine kinase ChiS
MAQPVLLIEDDPDIRLLAEMTLRLNGIDVVAYGEAQLALQAMEKLRFSLVITDVMMPDMSGYEVVNRIADRFGDQAPPVALFTARPQDATMRELQGRPVASILPKPFDPESFADQVLKIMRD